MLLRTAATAAGLTIAGMIFTAGVGVGAAAAGGAFLACKAMKKRHSWKEHHHSGSVAEAMPDEGEPIPGANPI
jgi:hypothetical protein